MKRTAAAILILIHLAALAAGWIAPYPPDAQHRDAALSPPSPAFPLGSDEFGRDQLSRLLHGGRISLAAGLLATGLALSLGALIGSWAGYHGRWRDAALMRVSELFLALPWLYFLIAARATLPLSIEPATSFLLVSSITGLLGWPRVARIVRGLVLSEREREYIHLARGFGASDRYILLRHIFPATLGVLQTQFTVLAPRFILAEVTLSFFGLGVGEPAASWGNMLQPLRQTALISQAWWLASPLAALVIVSVCFQVIGEQTPSDYGTFPVTLRKADS